jgi:hypothetical protein
MSERWTAADYRRDASDLRAEAADDALGEIYAGRDEWADDELPTKAELDADERRTEWDR